MQKAYTYIQIRLINTKTNSIQLLRIGKGVSVITME